MPEKKYKYNLKLLLTSVILWELIFWFLTFQFLFILGFFKEDLVGEQVNFLAPEKAWYFVLVLIYILLFFYFLFKRNTFVLKLKSQYLVSSLLRSVSTKRTFFRYFLIRNILVFIIIAAMQPSFGEKTLKGKASGVEIVFALDISNSMNANDMSNGESRLTAAKRAMNQFINLSASAKVGMLVFAGSVYPQLPLTADKTMAKMHLDQLSTDLISNQGTNIGLALDMASTFFTEDELHRVVVLITDGEDHEGGINEAIDQLKENDIELYILGLGTEEGALVPKDPNNPNSGYLKDDLGRSIISKLDRGMMSEISKLADAPLVISNDGYPNVSKLLTQINNLKVTKDVDLEFNIKANRYQLPLGIALFLLFVLFIWETYVKNKYRNN